MSDAAKTPTRNFDETWGSLTAPAWTSGMFIGCGALIVAFLVALGSGDSMTRFLHAYLLNYAFFLAISLGALFFVPLQHMVGAAWSVVIRRQAEALACNLPFLGLLSLPIVVSVLTNSTSLYIWNKPHEVLEVENATLAWKSPYLNPYFFVGRLAVYFVLWTLISRFYLSKSTSQDESGDRKYTGSMETWAPLSTIAFALTSSFAAIDLFMSLDPLWYSTIYGVYYFGGAMGAFFATLILIHWGLQKAGKLQGIVTKEHYHDLGKFMFGFVVFWAYIMFSQFMLIWYGNIPEETTYYDIRMTAPWVTVFAILAAGHFAIPFLGFMSRWVKRNPNLLAFWAIWMLVFHWVDMFFLISPRLSLPIDGHSGEPRVPGLPLGALELLCFVGIGGLWFANFVRISSSYRLVPKGDPRLAESLAFKNY